MLQENFAAGVRQPHRVLRARALLSSEHDGQKVTSNCIADRDVGDLTKRS